MNEVARFALQVEADFLARVGAKLEQARGQELPGSLWQRADYDQTDRLRKLMQGRGLHDRELLSQLPHNRRKTLRGYERTWWLLGKKPTTVAAASVLAPLADYLPGADAAEPGPIDLAELADHVRSLVADEKTPHVIGVCSPSGFTEQAEAAAPPLGNVTLVLIEPRRDGGWSVRGAGEDADKAICKLFDPETVSEKIHRVQQTIERQSAELLTSGLSAATIQEDTGLDRETVAAGFQAAADADPGLHLARGQDEPLLYRGTPEKKDMSIPDFIRQLFRLGGDETKKINHLSEQRATLSQRRDRIFEDITKLESKEADLLEQGRLNKSETVRRRVASQISQTRKEIARHNSGANMLGQQINIVSTHIHNLTLIQQGKAAEMPKAEEIAEDAVRAEEMLESLKADADLVSSLDTGVADALGSEDEQAIMAEFEDPQARPEKATEPPAAAPEATEDTPAQPERREPEAS